MTDVEALRMAISGTQLRLRRNLREVTVITIVGLLVIPWLTNNDFLLNTSFSYSCSR
jgi:hypothetical protein